MKRLHAFLRDAFLRYAFLRYAFLSILALPLWILATASGDPPGPDDGDATAGASARSAFLDRWAKSLEDVETLRVRFKQTKTLKILRRPRESEGVALLRGRRLLMRISDASGARETELLVDGDRVSILSPGLKRLEIYDVAGEDPPEPPFPMFGADVRSLPERYRVEMTESGSRRVLTLRPRDEKARISGIRMTFDDLRLVLVEQESARGDLVKLTIEEFTVNPELAAEDLELHVPEGTKTVHVLGG